MSAGCSSYLFSSLYLSMLLFWYRFILYFILLCIREFCVLLYILYAISFILICTTGFYALLDTVYFILFHFVLLSACHSIYPFYLFACCISFLLLSVSCFTLCATLYEHTVRIYLCMNVNVARACT